MSHVAFAHSARLVLPRRLLLKAAHHHEGMYSKSAGYYLLDGRWHKLKTGQQAPKGAPVAAHPKAAGHHEPAVHFSDEQWSALKLPEDNSNAASHNKKIDQIKELSEAGNVTGLLGLSVGSNTYGVKQAKIINHLLGLHGSAHQVAPGQKAGAHAAVLNDTTPPAPHPSGLPEHLAPKTTTGLQEPGGMSPLAQHVKDSLDQKAADGDVEFIKLVAANNPEHPQIVAYAKQKLAELGAASTTAAAPALPDLDSPEDMAANHEAAPALAMPAFEEGKTTTGVKAYYEKVAKKVIDHGLAGNVAVLEGMKDVNGKSWQGKTANSKKLLALHAAALAHASGGSGAATDQSGGPMPVFQTYSEANDWAKSRAKEKGLSWKAYTASSEYKDHVFPALAQLHQSAKAGWDAENAETGKKMQAAMADAGVKPGDTVSWTQVGSFLSQTKMSGVVKLDGNGVPFVHLTTEVAVSKPGGKIGYAKKLRWQPYMAAAVPAAPKAPLEQQMDDDSSPLPSGIKTKIDAMDASELSALVATHSGPGGFKKILAYAQAKLAAKQAPATGGKPADAAAGPTPLASFDGAGDTVAEVHKNPKGFAVVLKDKDSGESLPSITIYPTQEWATSSAENLAAGKPAPKEGDTKPGADGGTLVLKDGHWVKQGGDEPAAVKPEHFEVSAGDVFKLDSQYQKMNAGEWVVYNISADGAQVYMHKVGAKVPNQTNSATIPAATLAEAVAKGTAKKQTAPPAPASKPATGSLSPQQLQNLQSIPWHKLKLPAENTNAKSHNAAVAKIEAMAFAGDTAGLQAFIDAKGGAKQTYAKKQVLLAQTALSGLHVQGATAAVAVEPAPAKAADKSLAAEQKAATSDQHQLLDGWVESLSDGKVPTKEQAEAYEALADGDPNAAQEAFLDVVAALIPESVPSVGPEFDAAYQVATEKAQKLHRKAISGAKPTPAAKPPVTADTPLTQGQKDAVDGMSMQDLQVLAGDDQPLPPNVKAAIKKKLAEKQAAATPKPVQAPKTILHNTLPGHSKSWSVYVAPNASGGFDMVTEYGKIGGTQQKTVKSYATAGEANTAAAALKNTKFKKGYVQQPTDYDHTVPAPGTAANPAPAAPTGPVALDAGKLDALKASVKGHSNSEFLKTLKPAALSGDTAAIQKWKAANAGKLPNTQKLADKILAAMGGPKEGDTKQGADGLLVLKNGHWVKVGGDDAGWKHSPSDPGMSGYPSLSSDSGLIVWAADENVAEFHYDFDAEDPTPITAESLPDLLQKMVAAGYQAPTLTAMQKLDPGFKASEIPAVKAAPAKPAAFTMGADGLPSMDDWEQIGGQGGSNPGGKFQDPTGQDWYCKWPGDHDAIKSEVLAAKLYALAGLSAQDCMVVSKGGKPAIATKWVNIKKAGTAAALAKVPGALEGFAVDAWLGNWDVVGMSLDNLQIGPDGKAHRVDAGGSLEYRAQGAKKPFGPKVEEIATLRDAAKNPHAAAVFAGIKQTDLLASVAKVAAISDVAIRAMVNEHGPGDAAAKKKLADTLIARKQDLIKQFPKAAKPKKKPTFDPGQISAPPSFLNWGGSGKSGPSSKEFLNKANDDAVQAIFAAAKTGNIDAIKSLTAPVFDKDTGQVTGHKSVLDHPSQHVKGYAQQAVNEIHYQLNPPKKFRFDGGHPLHALNNAYPAHAGAKSSAIAQKLGKFIVLGEPGSVKLEEMGLPAKITHAEGGGPLSRETYKAQARAAWHKMPATQRQAVQAYTGASYKSMNGSLWDGNPTGAAKSAAEALHTLAHDIAPGTVLSRHIDTSKFAAGEVDKLLASTGKVLQEPAIMSTSIRPSSWIKSIQFKLHVGPGVKGLWVGPGSNPDGGAISVNQGEDEMLLPPNTRLLILSVKKAGGHDPDGFGQHGQKHVIEAIILPTN